MDLGDWRSRINDIDNQILHLLNQRAEAAIQIGDLKRRQEAPSYVPEREAEVLMRLADASRRPPPAEAATAVSRGLPRAPAAPALPHRRPAAGRGGDGGVAGDPVGEPGPRGSPDRGLPGPTRHVH